MVSKVFFISREKIVMTSMFEVFRSWKLIMLDLILVIIEQTGAETGG